MEGCIGSVREMIKLDVWGYLKIGMREEFDFGIKKKGGNSENEAKEKEWLFFFF